MTTVAMTREERYLLNLHLYLEEKGVSSCSTHAIAEKSGLSERQMNTTLQTLSNVNFVKKINKTEIGITQNGLNLLAQLGKIS